MTGIRKRGRPSRKSLSGRADSPKQGQEEKQVFQDSAASSKPQGSQQEAQKQKRYRPSILHEKTQTRVSTENQNSQDTQIDDPSEEQERPSNPQELIPSQQTYRYNPEFSPILDSSNLRYSMFSFHNGSPGNNSCHSTTAGSPIREVSVNLQLELGSDRIIYRTTGVPEPTAECSSAPSAPSPDPMIEEGPCSDVPSTTLRDTMELLAEIRTTMRSLRTQTDMALIAVHDPHAVGSQDQAQKLMSSRNSNLEYTQKIQNHIQGCESSAWNLLVTATILETRKQRLIRYSSDQIRSCEILDTIFTRKENVFSSNETVPISSHIDKKEADIQKLTNNLISSLQLIPYYKQNLVCKYFLSRSLGIHLTPSDLEICRRYWDSCKVPLIPLIPCALEEDHPIRSPIPKFLHTIVISIFIILYFILGMCALTRYLK